MSLGKLSTRDWCALAGFILVLAGLGAVSAPAAGVLVGGLLVYLAFAGAENVR